jgi:membrane protease YdiL (CAAX protease family)
MRRSRAGLEIILLFFALFFPGYLAQASLAGSGKVTDGLMLQSIVTAIPQLLLMAYVAGVKGPWSDPQWGCVRMTPRDGLRVLVLVAGCFAIAMPALMIASALPEDWRNALTLGYRWSLSGYGQLPLALLFGLAAGYREEFFFRAYLLARLEELGVPGASAVAGSTLLFCLGHVYEGPLGVLTVAALGVLLCVVYRRRPNLHVIAVSHGLYNTLALLLSLLLPSV